MIGTTTALDQLKRSRPEWAPWLAVVEEALRQAAPPGWDTAVPVMPPAQSVTVPLLAGVTLAVPGSTVRRLFERLVRTAAAGGTPKMATLQLTLSSRCDVLALLQASLRQDSTTVEDAARACGADTEALQALVALLGVPVLHACSRAWSRSIPQSWLQGYCPVCGSWPAFAEVRGIERSRYFRCARCSAEWHAHGLYCPYCATTDHDELVALVPDRNLSQAVIEACRQCHGYVKTFTRLQGCPPGTVMIEDVASVDLDVAALEQGYTRPTAPGCRLDVTVVDQGPQRRFFAWRS